MISSEGSLFTGSTKPVQTTVSIPSVAEACPETVKCMVGCNGPYNLTTTGKTCPDCQCIAKGKNFLVWLGWVMLLSFRDVFDLRYSQFLSNPSRAYDFA